MKPRLPNMLVLLAAWLFLASVATSALCQAHGGHQTQHGVHEVLPVLVNGAETPDRIPDTLAYAHFVLSVAEPDQPSPAQHARRAAILARIQLSTKDSQALLAALRGVHHQLVFLAREVERLSADPETAASRLDDFRVRRTRILEEAVLRFQAGLSPKGSEELRTYVRAFVKPATLISGDQPQ